MIDVLVVGETHAAGLTGSYVRAFRDAGARVELFDYYGVLDRLTPSFPVGRFVSAALQSAARPAAERTLIQRAAELEPRLVFFVKSDDIHGHVYASLSAMRPRPVLAAFHPDSPFNNWGLFRRGPSHPRASDQIAAVDHYFVWSHRLVEGARAAGAHNSHYLAFAYDPALHAFAPPSEQHSEQLAVDVVFVGNWDAKREAWLSAFQGAGLRVAIWGTRYWSERCSSKFLRAAWQGRPVYGQEFARIVSAAGACINLLREQNRGAHNMRTFEVPGCGGVLVSEWSEDQASHFTPGREAVYFRTPEEMVEQARTVCRLPRNQQVALRNAARVRALGATYSVRAAQVLALTLGR